MYNMLTASHILLRGHQQDRKEQLLEWKKEIGDDYTKFAEYAKQHSACPSGGTFSIIFCLGACIQLWWVCGEHRFLCLVLGLIHLTVSYFILYCDPMIGTPTLHPIHYYTAQFTHSQGRW